MKSVTNGRIIGLLIAMIWGISPALFSADETPALDESELPGLVEEIGKDPLPPGVVTPWGRYGEEYAEGLVDVLLPLYFDSDAGSLFFINFRGAYSDVSEQELNIGLGYRQLLEGYNTILGLNTFYDSRWTEEDHQFNQLGVGIEVLSKWVDARANGYFPENTKELIETVDETLLTGSSSLTTYTGYGSGHTIYERSRTETVNSYVQNSYSFYDVPLEGVDMEIGLRIPMPVDWLEARIFGGYYAFQPVWEGDLKDANDMDGFKGRAEVRIYDNLIVDAEVFEDDRLFGSDYLVSARVRLPFDMSAISRGENPFKSEPTQVKPITRRFSEMVMRDPHIQIRQETQVDAANFQETVMNVKNYPVLENVIFVDGDNAADPSEDGSAENPYDVIQEGVDRSAEESFQNVFVQHAENPYVENVLVTENIKLHGGSTRFGQGTAPGDGLSPIVQSAGKNPFIFTFEGGGSAILTGFTIDGTPQSRGGAPVIGGALFNNVEAVTVSKNLFHDLPVGVAGFYDGPVSATSFSMEVTENTFKRNSIAVSGMLSNPVTFTVANNTIQDAILGVSALSASSLNRSDVRIVGNRITSEAPLDMMALGGMGEFLNDFLPVTLPDELPLPMVGGILVGTADGKMTANISDNTVQGSLLGITAFNLNLVANRSDLDLNISGNRVQGGGLVDTLDLLLNSGALKGLIPVRPGTVDLDLPFDAGIAGITLLSLGPNARINDAVIKDNEVWDNLLGITTVAAAGAKARRQQIHDNDLYDNFLGITALGLLDGNLNELSIEGNTVSGGGTRTLASTIEEMFAPLPFDVPDFSLTGISVIGFNTDDLNDIEIRNNQIQNQVLGITTLGFGQVNLKDMVIANNNLDNTFSGVLLLGLGKGVRMTNARITDNQISGAGTGFVADVLGAVTHTPFDFPDVGLLGVGLAAIDGAKLNDFQVSGNQISEQLFGVGLLGVGEGLLKDGIISNNRINYRMSGVLGGSVYGSKLNNLLIMNNSFAGKGIALPPDLPIDLSELFGEKAPSGVGIYALEAEAKNATVVGNTISNNQIGIDFEEDGGNINGLTTTGNVFIENDVNVLR